MKKPLKVLSASAIAAVFATTALVPVASAEVSNEKETAKEIDFVVFNTEQGLLTLETLDYVMHYTDLEKEVTEKQASYLQADNGEYYDLLDYVLNYKGDQESTFKSIKPVELDKVLPGKIENGYVVADEQPEDRLNETFFYNVA